MPDQTIIDVKGARVPALGFGTWQITGRACVRAVRTALDLGYRHIDTAQIYDNEAEVGEAIAESAIDRSEVFLTTKVWYERLAAGTLEASVEESLKKLQVDQVDLLLIHWPNPKIDLAETMRALEGVKAAGRAKLIGLSNFPVALMKRVVEELGVDVAADQVEYHPYLNQDPVLAYARAHGMMVTAYSPLARGKVADDPVIREIAEAHDASPAQVVLRWLIDQPMVSAIPKAGSEAHIRANLAALDIRLSDAERAKIDALRGNGRMINPSFAPEWDAA
ncbi:MAG: 2,5-didehydrogluconate reductase B [Tistrella sp.]|jgi:2,5-diketo-D-gluconate reductase B|uniref:2,5-didehydrogluconate reductase B n=1 Tax=Tistrella mobilis TaxID=171437 RepID=A0A3B9IHD3_9PROT|nr:aldo/keto reductase [Tistrella sp.]MAD36526.1 2,5-didehydrogluconate reductase B [Tistrella sp.]MBA75632.1 2,5-didehydrogluconate reductase B [Tistrella sp.]HAE47128.1 2,5-didehydrogluconate reductase B [Tistrella mobilis]|tara:strand:+ start:210 stop:1043 length:834 start_codon:yes stop_codon:yes gene_type:complete